MKKATVTIPFFDLQGDVQREIGDTFSCDEERARQLIDLSLIKAEDEPKPKAKKTATKKK